MTVYRNRAGEPAIEPGTDPAGPRPSNSGPGAEQPKHVHVDNRHRPVTGTVPDDYADTELDDDLAELRAIEAAPQPEVREYTYDEWPPPEMPPLAVAAAEADAAATAAIRETLTTIDTYGHAASETVASVAAAEESVQTALAAYDDLSDAAADLEHDARQAGVDMFGVYGGATASLQDTAGSARGELLDWVYAIEDARAQTGGDLSKLVEVLDGEFNFEEYNKLVLVDSGERVAMMLMKFGDD